MLLHNEFLNITDRQKDGQKLTYGRRDVHQDTETVARWDSNEARHPRQDRNRNRDKRQKTTDESRDKRGDKDDCAVWRTLRHVLLWWWVGGCVVLVCCCVLLGVVGGVAWLCVVACVVWLCLSRWGLLSGGRLPSPFP